MSVIKGIDVILHERTKTGVDGFGTPVFEDIPVTVSNVLVSPSSQKEVVTATSLYGKKAVYTLAIPKGDTHKWTDTTVEFFSQKWRTFGHVVQGIEDNIPLDWNKKVKVEAYGD